MKKNLLCAALFVAGISSVHAEQTTWNFAYQGFVDATTGVFDPEMKYTGSFTGEDRNLDGIVMLDELSYFESQGHDYVPEKIIPGSGGCGSSTLQCKVYRFSYALTGALYYSVATFGTDELRVHWWSSSGATRSSFSGGGGNLHTGGDSWFYQYEWSDRTTFTISPAPVPEPTVALMLPAGLALMYLTRVRRRNISA
ncbi:PEP-CTERM sorting domain-containing protein [Janthinobacterium sp. BJB301]|uniref:PEP-CTERM sorting domain-containing protein n=1 Tax=Janthinobacterium sp. BJB301 TaxID=1560195 RepID=UPI0015D4CEDC|nr:PEP-CTERM sorting domain-containing protein [Janthinobacterium sp. BJB301]